MPNIESGGKMRTMLLTPPKTEAERRSALHADLDAMNAEQLALFERVLLTIRAQDLAAEIGAAFDEARRDGRMTDEKIRAAIAEHRAKHPYR